MTITYDAIGNPTSMTIGEGVYTLSWEQGRQLAGISYTAPDNEGNYELSFRYNVDGLRIHKEYINDYDGTYYYMESEYDGSTLIRETHIWLLKERRLYYDNEQMFFEDF